jgi:molybdate transport system ATP-binding protein
MNELALQLHCRGEHDFELEVDCRLPGTGVTAVYGPSGSGKSTLLDCIAGLRQPEPGSSISLGGESWLDPRSSLPPWRRELGYVFQDARLFPHLDVQGNLQYASQRARGSGDVDREQVVEWLQLGELLPRSPDTLSAGQKQRVAIGRALLAAPRILLLDEPLANLDHAAAGQCLSCLQRLAAEYPRAMLYVSHDIEEVSQLADHILLLENGRVRDQGAFLELCSRLDTGLAHEEQAAAIITAQVARHDPDYGLTELALEGQTLLVNHLAQAVGQRQRVRIPARDVSVCREHPQDSSILNILPVTLAQIEDTAAARLLLRLALGEQHLLARITRKSCEQLGLAVGDRLYAQVKSAALLMEAADPA